ncbi:MAG: M20 family metallo-hydrolase [Treponema sp.]|jgi:succinyl-diaminopimelate desuccinylase|nr:M20 family metallo-hydrolase [Treponema sp.]
MKEKLFSWIDNSVSLAVELETELTKRPAISPDSCGEGELDKCLFLENWLKAHGIAQIERYDSPDARAKGGVRPNLIATIPGTQDNERLWIMSHIDVVPPGEAKLWNSDPWTVKYDTAEKRLYGRGTEDNQQGIVSSIIAALSFTEQGLKPQRTIKLLFASDEETGSIYGMDWLVKNKSGLFNKDDMVLIPDGGDLKGELIEIAEKNILWMRFVTKGKQAHGSMPDTGINAFLAGSDLAVRLYNGLSSAFNKRDSMFDPNYSTFQPTKKEANVPNVNTIPGEDIFYMDMRVLPCYPTASILEEIDKIKAEVEKKYRVTVEYGIFQKTESKPTAPDAPIVMKLNEAACEVYAVKPKLIGIGGGTMAAFLRNIGIDCAVWTKTAETLHQPDEYALIDNILGDAKVITLLAIH